MKSLAVWYESKQNNSSISELELHFNHWKIGKKQHLFDKEFEYILDIGIKVKNGEDVKNLCFFFPDTTSLELEDLGKKLKEPKLLAAVFNENYKPKIDNNNKFHEIWHGDKAIFNVYSLDEKEDFKSELKFDGTVLKFPFKFFPDKDTYYRIRLKTPFVKKFSYIYKPKNSILDSVFSSVELIDFRVNDTRDINLNDCPYYYPKFFIFVL